MKCSTQWLAEYLHTATPIADLAEHLIMHGIELELTPVATLFTGVVAGTIIEIHKHPQADKLNVCVVQINPSTQVSIICGASNPCVGMKVAAALPGATLPPGITITAKTIRGVRSQGMLCSAAELGLPQWQDPRADATKPGIISLPLELNDGSDIWEYYQLSDHILNVTPPPNRGDCISVYGLARELANLIPGSKLAPLPEAQVTVTSTNHMPLTITASADCHYYSARIINNIDPSRPSPTWVQERLRRSGMKSINLVVDITNYVMLELGQPLHAFALDQLHDAINIRHATAQESFLALDGSLLELSSTNLVIADRNNVLAIAGVMGGMNSGISANTTDILLESAYFKPSTVAASKQEHQLFTEAAYRFERNIDPTLTALALERATALIISLAGGQAGPVTIQQAAQQVPRTISLRRHYFDKIIGPIAITDAAISDILATISTQLSYAAGVWQLTIPAWRHDLQQEIDLVEEIIRLYGYSKIAPTPLTGIINASHALAQEQLNITALKNFLVALGYHEVITYSFVASSLQTLLHPDKQSITLSNPLVNTMDCMRISLWPGLVQTYLYNRDHQQENVRFFETGLCFTTDNKNQFSQLPLLAGLISGNSALPTWGSSTRQLDFYDTKGDLEQLMMSITGFNPQLLEYQPCQDPALHPYQAATITYDTTILGMIGRIHPRLQQELAITEPLFLFSLNLDALLALHTVPAYRDISKYPAVYRDLALIAAADIPVADITKAIITAGGGFLQDIALFDVYKGPKIPAGHRSIAFTLTLQDPQRTLTEDEINTTLLNISQYLEQHWQIKLRDY